MNDIVVSEDVLAARGGHGESVATITVNRADGKIKGFLSGLLLRIMVALRVRCRRCV